MRELCIVLGCVFAQTISFCISYKIIFNQNCTENKWKRILYFFLIVLIQLILFYKLGAKESYDYTIYTQLLIPLLLIDKKKFVKYIQFAFISVATPLLGIVPLNIIAMLQNKPIYYYLKSIKYLFVIELVIATIMLLLYVMLRSQIEYYYIDISLQGYIAILAVVCSSLLFVACVQEMSKIYEDNILNIIGVASSVACLIPIIVVVWLIRTEQKRSELEIRNRITNELLIMQKKYNENFIANNEQLRRFRHDFKGHINVIQKYCIESNVDKIQEYLNKMVEDSLINFEYKYTGNMEIDAIIAPLVRRCEKQNIKVDISGFLPKEINNINIYDICSIFFNLVSNAVEECERVLPNDSWIKIELAVYNGFLRLLIENSAESLKDTKKIHTQKDDTREHGIGLRNVKGVVEKYKGKINIRSTSETYSVEIMI